MWNIFVIPEKKLVACLQAKAASTDLTRILSHTAGNKLFKSHFFEISVTKFFFIKELI